MATSAPAPPWSASPPEHQRRGREVGRVLVLNATYEPINVCTVRRAVVLLLKEKAEIIERAEFVLHAETCTIARPIVIKPSLDAFEVLVALLRGDDACTYRIRTAKPAARS